MANFLSLLFQAKLPTGGSPHEAHRLAELFAPHGAGQANSTSDILHYAWVSVLPPSTAPPGNWVLLTTAYDLDFKKYIEILVQTNPELFNDAVRHLIVGAEHLYPVFDPKDPSRLANFISWIQANDLAQRDPLKGNGGVLGKPFQGYYWKVNDILSALRGPGKPSE
jgi:hypothetical protein